MVISLALAPTRDVKGSFIRLLPTIALSRKAMSRKKMLQVRVSKVESSPRKPIKL